MNIIKEKLGTILDRPEVKKFKQEAVKTAVAVEGKILQLPRPLRDLDDDKVTNLLSRGLTYGAVAAYSVRSGKALALNLKNRELNTYGRVSARIALVAGPVFAVLAVHELWARLRAPLTNEELLEELMEMMRERREAAATTS